jgi:hypothetical protein
MLMRHPCIEDTPKMRFSPSPVCDFYKTRRISIVCPVRVKAGAKRMQATVAKAGKSVDVRDAGAGASNASKYLFNHGL